MKKKIIETVERLCCEPKDLKPYLGCGGESVDASGNPIMYFCKHCGQLWLSDSRMDAAGSSSPCFIKTAVAKYRECEKGCFDEKCPEFKDCWTRKYK